LEAALKARTLFKKEKDYIVKDNQVILVDEFTGRLMMGRRLSEGLHQAIEAKENVPIQRESKTMATVSLQNYFRMYEKLAGMTGTAVTEAQEFHKIYNLSVIVIPTNKLMIRKDEQDLVYKSGRAKLSAVASEIERVHKTGQPVLVGTTSIDKNELISELLKRRGIKHEILNAKNHEQEARIISRAGEKGAVTVATNMAGRGVDIILGGETPNTEEASPSYKAWKKEHEEVVKLGGLYVIGTERHESRRIDNQLRGRSGRQGDLGSSRFFVALDDEIMRLFGGDTISGVMTRFNMPEDVPLQHMIVSKAIEQAQTKVEGFNFDIRKQLVEYDDVLNKQREIIYKRRRIILENKESLEAEVMEKIDSSATALVNANSVQIDDKLTDEKIVNEFATIIPFDDSSKKQLVKQLETAGTTDGKISFLTNITHDIYEQRKKQLGKEMIGQIERYVMLSVIDALWMDHLDAVENLRGGIGLRGYGQRDPLVEYKNEAYAMFEQLIQAIDDEVAHRIYKIQIQQAPQPRPQNVVEQAAGESSGISETSGTNAGLNKTKSTADGKKLGRNDPCWCESGKKYKKCHYPN
jgi:preprotein translocase subunit SecA